MNKLQELTILEDLSQYPKVSLVKVVRLKENRQKVYKHQEKDRKGYSKLGIISNLTY